MASISAITNGEVGVSVRDKINQAITEANRVDAVAASAYPSTTLVLHSEADLPAAVGDEHILPGKMVRILGDLALGDKALRFSKGTVVVGDKKQVITSSNASGVIRATNIDSPVIFHDVNVVATGGDAFALTGTTAHQLNCSFVGVFGVSAGTITGFDVQSFKTCFFDTVDGLRHDGTTNKIFVSDSPFYTLAPGNAAITFASTLVAQRADIDTNFFKSDAGSFAMRAEAGYSLGMGRATGSMKEGPDVMLDGITPADTNWWFNDNGGIRDSRVTGQASLDAQTVTPITVVGQYEQLAGTFSLDVLSERMTLNGANELVNNSGKEVLVTLTGLLTLDPASDVRVGIRVTKNGVAQASGQAFIEQGTGPASQPRPGMIITLVNLEPGESAGLAIANLTDTSDVLVQSVTFTEMAG